MLQNLQKTSETLENYRKLWRLSEFLCFELRMLWKATERLHRAWVGRRPPPTPYIYTKSYTFLLERLVKQLGAQLQSSSEFSIVLGEGLYRGTRGGLNSYIIHPNLTFVKLFRK